jgi:hypothetical protein
MKTIAYVTALLLLSSSAYAQGGGRTFFDYVRGLQLLTTPAAGSDEVLVCQNNCPAGEGLARMPLSAIPNATPTAQKARAGVRVVNRPSGSYPDFVRGLPVAGAVSAGDQMMILPNGCGASDDMARMSISGNRTLASQNVRTPTIGPIPGGVALGSFAGRKPVWEQPPVVRATNITFRQYFCSLPQVVTSAPNDQILVCPKDCASIPGLSRMPISRFSTFIPVQEVFYATTGNDPPTGTGSAAQPFRTPAQAQQRVRQLLAASGPNIVVWGHGGTYRLTGTMEFTTQDSAAPGRQVLWASFPNEKAIWSGSVKVGPWTEGANSEWETHVPATPDTFREFYVNGVHRQRSRGLHNTTQPANWTVDKSDVVIDGTGPYNRIHGYQIPATDPILTFKNPQDIELVYAANAFQIYRCKVHDISASHYLRVEQPCLNAVNLWAYIVAGDGKPWRIENAHEMIPSCWQNYRECWYFDRPTRTLYYRPRAGETINNEDAEVPSVEQLVRLDGAHNLTFSRLTFTGSSWLEPDTPLGYAGIHSGMYCNVDLGEPGPAANPPGTHQQRLGCHFYVANPLPNPPPLGPPPGNYPHTVGGAPSPAAVSGNEASHDITFEHDRFIDNASYQLGFYEGSQRVDVLANDFEENAGGCFWWGGMTDMSETDPAKQTADLLFENNKCGGPFEYYESAPVLRQYSRNAKIIHNDIKDGGWADAQTGWGGWNWINSYSRDNTFSYNKLSNACWLLYDCGALYNNGMEINNRVIGNYSDNPYDRVFDATWYLDEASSNVLLEDNVAVGGWPMWLTSDGGRSSFDNVARNNFSTLPGTAISNRTRFPETVDFQNATQITAASPPPAAAAIMENAGVEKLITPGP